MITYKLYAVQELEMACLTYEYIFDSQHDTTEQEPKNQSVTKPTWKQYDASGKHDLDIMCWQEYIELCADKNTLNLILW